MQIDKAAILKAWGIPFVSMAGDKLVPKEYAAQLIEKIYAHGCVFYGYDAFLVLPDGRRQPYSEYSASFSKQRQPTCAEAIDSLQGDLAEITHYEFVF